MLSGLFPCRGSDPCQREHGDGLLKRRRRRSESRRRGRQAIPAEDPCVDEGGRTVISDRCVGQATLNCLAIATFQNDGPCIAMGHRERACLRPILEFRASKNHPDELNTRSIKMHSQYIFLAISITPDNRRMACAERGRHNCAGVRSDRISPPAGWRAGP